MGSVIVSLLTFLRLQSVWFHLPACLFPILTSFSYFKNGCQINSPMDKEISDSIERNLEPWPNAWTESPPTGDYFHPKAYEQLLPRYTTRVWHYSVQDPIPAPGYILITLEIHRPTMETPKAVCLHSLAWRWRASAPGPVPFIGHYGLQHSCGTNETRSKLPNATIPKS
jgi:hypothetical protein